MIYRILLAIDLLTTCIVVYFFFAGAIDGSVSDFNIWIWLKILLGLTLVLGGGIWLHRASRTVMAAFVLAMLAVPALLYAFFMLVVLLSGESWN